MNNSSSLDIRGNRSATKYSKREMFLRVLWMLVSPLFRFSPRPFFAWRNALLRAFGAKIGTNVHVYNSAVIYMPWNLEVQDWSSVGEHSYIYNLGKITIGNRVTISYRVHLCAGTHDFNKPDLPLLKPPIRISDEAWICTDAFVGPNVVVGEGAVVGARAVVTKNVPAWAVVAGNPANIISQRNMERECQK